jgi:phytoene dehydrogenase-like protein
MNKKVNIVGAGIAGLSAGCYLRANGYDTEIFELHSLPGGLCTAWQRGGYTFDGCIHWLVGSNPADPFYALWNELIDMSAFTFVEPEEAMRVEDASGKYISVFADIDRIEQEMLSKAPGDADLIRRYTAAARKFTKFQFPLDKAPETQSLFDKACFLLKCLPYIKDMKYWMSITGGQLAAQCQDPLLRATFRHMFVPDMAALFLVWTQAWRHKKSAGYPVGGSLPFARKIEEKYLALGGRINYNARVTKILVENDTAKGIQLENGETHPADIVVSAADGRATIYEMLQGRYVDSEIRRYYEHFKVFPSWLQVSLGLSRMFEGTPHTIVFPLEKPIKIDDKHTRDHIGVRIFNFDPTMAPPGKTVVTAMFPTDNHTYWQNLRDTDKDAYNAEKQRIAREVILALDTRFGHIRAQVEQIDVSTPATVIRCTNNWKGSLEGWVLTPDVGFLRMKKTLPGLRNFYMAGQWVEPGGGLPTAFLSGRNVTQLISKHDAKKFQKPG